MEAVLSFDAVASERSQAIFMAKREAQTREKQLLVSPENKTVNAALRRVCFILHRLAQKRIGTLPQDFNDYACLVHCTEMLQSMGLKPDAAAQLVDDATTAREIIFNSFEYRQLRNKMLASLSIIADLTERNTGNGSPEYQRGMREGYRRASDIAIMFLDDFTSGDH